MVAAYWYYKTDDLSGNFGAKNQRFLTPMNEASLNPGKYWH